MKLVIRQPTQPVIRDEPRDESRRFTPPVSLGFLNVLRRPGYRAHADNVGYAIQVENAQIEAAFNLENKKLDLQQRHLDREHQERMRVYELRKAEAEAEKAWQLAEKARLEAMEAQLRYEEALQDYEERRTP